MQSVETELQSLYESSDGLLRPEDVVEFARDPDTALHSRFEWDDTAAAHQWRLEQARHVIRAHVTVIEAAKVEVSAWVSLSSDRYAPGGGYRHIEDVLTNVDLRTQLLAQARKDFDLWRRKYQTLQELAPVFEAMERIAG